MPLPGKLGRGKQVKIGGQHEIKECPHSVNGRYIHHIPVKATDDKEMVKTYTADGARDLIVPKRVPIDVPVILPESELERLKQQAHVITKQDKLDMLEEAERQKTKLVMESNQRRDELMKSQLQQTAVPGSKLDAVDSEASSKNMSILQRSRELIIEQDDRVKVANNIILATKCRAIRNAQIAEKKLIAKQLQEEEMRLDMMMEQQRQKEIETEEKKREVEEIKKQRFVQEIQQQMKEREIERLLEVERIEEEAKMQNRALIVMQKEEEEKMKQQRARQIQMREEFKMANEEAQHYKNVRQEEEKIAEFRIQEFMRKKTEREEAREKEIAHRKFLKQQEIAMLRETAQKGQDMQAALDEMNALRAQEEKEKEWRENELRAAQKRKEMIEDLHASRTKQINDIRRAQAANLARDEEDFKKVAKVQRLLFEKDKDNEAKKRQMIARHRKELLMQINEKEKERITFQQEKFEDGKAQRLEFEVKDRAVEEYLKQKIDKLKETRIPENYVADIERSLAMKKL